MHYPSYVKDSILKWLQDLFGQEKFYERPNKRIRDLEDVYQPKQEHDLYDPDVPEELKACLVNDYKWLKDQEATGIHIADQWTENLERPEARPALIISRGPISWENRGGIDQHESSSFGSGAKRFTDMLFSQVTVNCFSREGLEAELLANLVFQAVRFFARELRNQTNIFEIDSASFGSEALIQSDSKVDWTVVPVSVVLHFQDRWLLKVPTQRPEKIETTLAANRLEQVTETEVVTLD